MAAWISNRRVRKELFNTQMMRHKEKKPAVKLPLAYRLNNQIRSLATKALRLVANRAVEVSKDLPRDGIDKILLVRGTFRMGSSVLATPAIFAFREQFPSARIDFVGSPLSTALYKNLPVDRCFAIARRFPQASWAYPALLRQIRSQHYDLAVEVSCSQSAMGSFIVGFSGARLRAGLRGKWDYGYNIRVPRPAAGNKYRALPAFLAALGLSSRTIYPRLILSPEEKTEGDATIKGLIHGSRAACVGVFVGGRKRKGKGWPMEKFRELIEGLHRSGAGVVVFFGPEEQKQMGSFGRLLGKDIPLVFEPSARKFAAMVSTCAVFITCDSGPMHLACALGVPTIAMFQNASAKKWGPPAELARVIGQDVPADEALKLSLAELSRRPVAGGSSSSVP